MPLTAVLVGSVELSAQSITVDGGGAVEVPAGSYYLRHATASLSLFDTLAATMASTGLVSASVTLLNTQRVRISALPNFSMTLSPRLQRLLGFDAPLGGGSNSYVANLPSPLLWAPGYLATPGSRAGKAGYKVPHVTRHKSDDGSRQETQFFGEEVWQDLEWPFVPAELLSVPDDDDDGGTLEGLYEETLKYGRPFLWHESMQLNGSTSAVGWPGAFGPYQLRRDLGRPNWYDRIQRNADDIGGGVSMQLHQVEELSNA